MPIVADIPEPVTLALPEPFASDVVLDYNAHQGIEIDSTGRLIKCHSQVGTFAMSYVQGVSSGDAFRRRRYRVLGDHFALLAQGDLNRENDANWPKMDGAGVLLCVGFGNIIWTIGYDAAAPSPQPYTMRSNVLGVETTIQKHDATHQRLKLPWRGERDGARVVVVEAEPGAGQFTFTHSMLPIVQTVTGDLYTYGSLSGAVPDAVPVANMCDSLSGIARAMCFKPSALYTPAEMAALRDWACQKYLGYTLGYLEI